ncbi:hypothetical protein L0156_06085 [bacterium]|nr:hypothetical protein [bacterium]
MRLLVQIMASLGVISFVMGSYMKIANVKHLFNVPPAGWWRASVAFLAIGILYVLIDIRDILRKSGQ